MNIPDTEPNRKGYERGASYQRARTEVGEGSAPTLASLSLMPSGG
jgi:hypothetical protein